MLFRSREGVEIGEKRGEIKKAKETALTLADMGFSVDQISKAVKVSVSLVKQWLEGNGVLAK